MDPAEVGGRLDFADIRLVIGTRPEAIKLAPLAHALSRCGYPPTLIFTGQHALEARAHDLEGFEAILLDCPGQSDPDAHVDAVARRMQRSLHASSPDLVVVQGDTSSALGAARACFAEGIAVAHVEAGLRSHDRRLPWPEEDYRMEIDRHAALLFAPTATSAANLQVEQTRGEIHVTGNTGVDAVLAIARALPAPRLADGGSPRVLVTCHRRESWDGGLEQIAAALRDIAEDGARIDLVLHPNTFVANRMQSLLSGTRALTFVPPCCHQELVQRMREVDLVLSDSGGIQEEAPTLGVPLLVLREKTERPEGIASGSARLVGTSREAIVREALLLLRDPAARAAMSRPSFPYGDGKAAPRIAGLIGDWLEKRAVPPYAAE